jgi:hypothetical protein
MNPPMVFEVTSQNPEDDQDDGNGFEHGASPFARRRPIVELAAHCRLTHNSAGDTRTASRGAERLRCVFSVPRRSASGRLRHGGQRKPVFHEALHPSITAHTIGAYRDWFSLTVRTVSRTSEEILQHPALDPSVPIRERPSGGNTFRGPGNLLTRLREFMAWEQELPERPLPRLCAPSSSPSVPSSRASWHR